MNVKLIFLVVATVVCGGARAQSGCGSALTGLAPCLSYITGGSPAPSSSCCSQLATVAQSSPECLCAVINGGGSSSFGVNINQTLALQLPAACNVQTPPPSRCSATNNGPTTSPAESPAESPAGDDTPEAAPTPSASHFPSGTGSKTVPSINGGLSNRNMDVLSITFMALVLNLTNQKLI